MSEGCTALLHEQWLVLITAATPVLELRGAIPLGLALGLSIKETFLLSLIGNIVPIPFILLGMSVVINWLKRIPRLHAWVHKKGLAGGDKLNLEIQRWGWLGLIIFVAIPLPGTGAWTGALAASFLRLKFWPALLSISIGVFIAGLLISGIGVGVLTFI